MGCAGTSCFQCSYISWCASVHNHKDALREREEKLAVAHAEMASLTERPGPRIVLHMINSRNRLNQLNCFLQTHVNYAHLRQHRFILYINWFHYSWWIILRQGGWSSSFEATLIHFWPSHEQFRRGLQLAQENLDRTKTECRSAQAQMLNTVNYRFSRASYIFGQMMSYFAQLP